MVKCDLQKNEYIIERKLKSQTFILIVAPQIHEGRGIVKYDFDKIHSGDTQTVY